MHDPLERLYKTKLQLLAVVSAFLGIAILVLAHVLARQPAWRWLASLPLTEIGSVLFSSGLLAVAFEYIDRRDGDERANARLRRVLRDEAPTLRQAVFDALAFSPDGLKEVASPELLSRITHNSLQLQLGSPTLADAVYADVQRQVLDAPERWSDFDAAITLTPWADGPVKGIGAMFVATIQTSYRTVPGGPTLRFACISDVAEFRDAAADPGMVSWYFQPIGELDGGSPESFELVQLTVDGHDQPIRRSKRKGSQTFTASLGELPPGRAVTITYTYRVLVQQAGHLLYLDIPRPTNGIRFSLNYDNSGIRYVSALDFIASSRTATVLRTPSSVPARTVDVAFDGWVFAKSAVIFVWVLDGEV